MTRTVVDFPAPLGPVKLVTCPGETVDVMPSGASVRPYRLRGPATSIVVSVAVVVRAGRSHHGARGCYVAETLPLAC